MKPGPDQCELPLEADRDPYEVERHWAKLAEIHAAEWTEENYCIAWATNSDGRAWRDWWAGLPRYERHNILTMYRIERERVEHGEEMRSFDYLKALEEELYQSDLKIAQKWALDIKEAACKSQPCPIIPSPENEYMLRWAFDLAGVVIVQPAARIEE